MKKLFQIIFMFFSVTVIISSCTTDKNAPGLEYMPDMYRSPALEAYVDYGPNQAMDWTEERKMDSTVYRVLSMKPPIGTIPYYGNQEAPFRMPYGYLANDADYERAGAELKSPLTATKLNIETGKALYLQNCRHCHGETGKGDGPISANGFIMGIPDYTVKLKDLPEGKIFHVITHGKGLMGPHASILNQKERWQVTEYVKLLQKGMDSPSFDDKGMVIVSTGDSTAVSSPAAAGITVIAPTSKEVSNNGKR